MKRFVWFFLLVLGMATTGCIDVTEELWLKKGGSGKYKVMVDMSSLMGPEIRGMLEGMMQEEGADGLNLDGPMELDSMVYFKDVNPEGLKELERPEVFESAYLHMEISESKEKMVIEMGLDFEQLSDIDYFNENIGKISDDQSGGMMGGILPKSTKLFSLKGKTLTRYSPDAPTDLLSDEEMEMAMMMLGTAKYKTIYHFPGKVKKTTLEDATIEGNKVIVKKTMAEVLKGESKLDGTIKFKW